MTGLQPYFSKPPCLFAKKDTPSRQNSWQKACEHEATEQNNSERWCTSIVKSKADETRFFWMRYPSFCLFVHRTQTNQKSRKGWFFFSAVQHPSFFFECLIKETFGKDSAEVTVNDSDKERIWGSLGQQSQVYLWCPTRLY